MLEINKNNSRQQSENKTKMYPKGALSLEFGGEGIILLTTEL